jgi:hypothetical protein
LSETFLARRDPAADASQFRRFTIRGSRSNLTRFAAVDDRPVGAALQAIEHRASMIFCL